MVTNLKELGMNAEVTQVDWTAYTNLLEQGTQNVVYFLGTIPSIPDPDASIRWLFSKDGAHGRYLKISQFKDYPTWDAQMLKAESSLNQEERSKIYLDLTRTMMQQVYHIPLYYKNAVMAKHDYVKALDVDALYVWDVVKPWANVYVEGKKS
jgi:ABC-type transport system substrate-binding protein